MWFMDFHENLPDVAAAGAAFCLVGTPSAEAV